MKLLLVEDEKRMADALSELLRQEGYEVTACHDGGSGLEAVLSGVYDVIVLDVMLPVMNGYEIVQTARSRGIRTPILLLTAKSRTADEVRGLNCGADDYLTKPFQMEVLTARLRALLRRHTDPDDDSLSFADLTLHRRTAELSCSATGRTIRLSEKEFKLMEYLLSNQKQIVTRENLALRVWGYDNDAEYNNVEVYISFTRKKIAVLDSCVEIKAVRGLGYELRIRPQAGGQSGK